MLLSESEAPMAMTRQVAIKMFWVCT